MTDMTIDEELSITCEQRDALDIECARLEKEVDALRQDAERYRWLRIKCGLVPSAFGIGQVAMTLAGSTDERDAKRLDAHIDAAMCEEGANV